MQALWNGVSGALGVIEPIIAALILIALLVYVGDRGSKIALNRNNPCMAAICIFVFALGSGFATWSLIMNPLFTAYYPSFSLSYSLTIMYWAFWLLIGVLITAKKLIYENARRPSQYFK